MTTLLDLVYFSRFGWEPVSVLNLYAQLFKSIVMHLNRPEFGGSSRVGR